MAVRPPDEALAQHLLKAGIVTEEQLTSARRAQVESAARGNPVPLGDVLVGQGIIPTATRENIERKLETQREDAKRLGRYHILRKLGEGGMGAVYLAEDPASGQKLALKVLPKVAAREEDAVRRFLREVDSARKLDHPNIVRAGASGEDKGFHYYVMEYVEGETLGGRLKRTEFVSPDEATRIVLQIAHGLKYAHGEGFIHRDIKPDNVVVSKEGVAKILDMGLSKNIDEAQTFRTVTGVALGTPHYIAPEQARGDKGIDGRADIYSLGATYYHLVTGETPFHGTTAIELIAQHLNKQIPDPQDIRDGIPDGVVHVIRNMMAKKPGDRYRDCSELVTDLELVLGGRNPSSQALDAARSAVGLPMDRQARERYRAQRRGPRPGAARPTTKARTSAAPLVIGGIVAAAVLVILLAVAMGGGSPPPAVARKEPEAEPLKPRVPEKPALPPPPVERPKTVSQPEPPKPPETKPEEPKVAEIPKPEVPKPPEPPPPASVPTSPRDGLVGHWTFDEGSGTRALDSSGSENHGTLKGAPEWVTGGRLAGALRFHGLDDEVYVRLLRPMEGNAVTLAAWVKHETLPNRIERYVCLKSGNTEVAVLRHTPMEGPGTAHFYVNLGGKLRIIRVREALRQGEWLHVAGTWDGAKQILYVNGIRLETQNLTGTLPAATEAVISGSGAESMDGLIDDVRIYRRALSADEVAALAAAPKPEVSKPPEPVVKPPPPAPARPAVPDAAKLQKAEAAVRNAFNLDQAKTPKAKADLARTLLSTAATSGAKEAELYVLLRMAKDLAAQGMDAKTALEAIDQRAAAFDVDAMAEKVDLFTNTTPKGQDAAAWAGAALDVAQEASEADDYERAVKLAARAEVLARASNDKTLQETTKDRSKEIADLKRVADGLKGHFKTLETKPDDPAANAAVGKFVSLVKGDWKRGLPMLAKGSDAALKTLAEQEVANPTDPEDQAALGKAWLAQADKETPTYKAAAKGRAKEWFDRAIPKLTGLKKVEAERLSAGLGPATGTKSRQFLDLGGGVRMELVYIKPGTFTMGSTEAPKQGWQVDERPEHRVTITKGYSLGKTEVTRGQFAAFVKATGYKTDAEKDGKSYGRRTDGSWGDIAGANWKDPVVFKQTDEHPAMCISWNDAKAFTDWATKKTGREVRLPTEAEWEFACRAGTKTRWWFGENEASIVEHGWTNANSGWQTQPVGQKKPNPWGLYDMYGNVWEWCQDWAGPYTAGDAVDPTGPAGGSARCLRGGGWPNYAVECRSAIRDGNTPTERHADNGFRVLVP